ncbi:MAG: hypothetical protein WCC95_17975 [Candidatus Sulfotelmatobacter sp.]
MVKVDNKRQPMKASMLPGKTKGGASTGGGAYPVAKSKNPGGFISMEAGANPNGPHMLNNGPRGDASKSDCQMGSGQKNRTVTSRDQSPYDVK